MHDRQTYGEQKHGDPDPGDPVTKEPESGEQLTADQTEMLELPWHCEPPRVRLVNRMVGVARPAFALLGATVYGLFMDSSFLWVPKIALALAAPFVAYRLLVSTRRFILGSSRTLVTRRYLFGRPVHEQVMDLSRYTRVQVSVTSNGYVRALELGARAFPPEILISPNQTPYWYPWHHRRSGDEAYRKICSQIARVLQIEDRGFVTD